MPKWFKVTKFGGQILATKFGFVPDCWVSGNLKKMPEKMFYSCLCTSLMSCYCLLTEKIDKNRSVVTIDHFSRLRVGTLLVSYGDSNVWPGGLLQVTVQTGLENKGLASTCSSLNAIIRYPVQLEAVLSQIWKKGSWQLCLFMCPALSSCVNHDFGLSTALPVPRSGLVWYFPDMSGWTSGPIFSGEVRFFPDIDRGTSGGDFENYAEPTTHVFRCF